MSNRNNESLKSQYCDVIESFLSEFNLKDGYGNASFEGRVKIDIRGDIHQFNADVRITREYPDYGNLKFFGDNIDSYNFPIEHSVEYQSFEFIDYMYLKITGAHSKHGKYLIRITPLITS